jgi:hypothetical protein
MRPYKPAQLFARPSILVQGTVAERWESALKEVIWDFTTRTLTVDPNQAGAYFLRGWALYLVNPTDRTAYTLVQRAATLAPTDTLFTASAAYLR